MSWSEAQLTAVGAADELRITSRREGRIDAGGVEQDVRFEEVPADEHTAVDAAYHAKYDHSPKQYADPVVSPGSWAATLRLVLAD